MGRVGRSGKKSTVLRYHRNGKDRRKMAPKQQTTAQPKNPQAAQRPHSRLWMCPSPRNEVPHITPESQWRAPIRPFLDQDLGVQAFKVTRF